MVNKGWSHIQDCSIHLATPQFRDSTREDPADTKMKVHEGITKYQFMSFLHEMLLFFINSFFLFPLNIKRIILYFVYLDDNQHTFVYPSLQEESLSHTCVVDVDPVSLPQPIYKEECWRQTPLEPDHSCSLEECNTPEF